jgi:hypothetical protein
MKSVIRHIARENFLKSGYVFFSERNQRMPWRIIYPSQSPLELSDALGNALRKKQSNTEGRFYL